MKIMDARKSHISSTFDGAEIKVYRANDTLKLNVLPLQATMSNNIKYIHTHFTYEIFFATKGNLTIVGESFRKTYEKSIIIIPPQFKHYTLPESEECFCLLFSIEKNTFKNIDVNGITTIPLTDDISFYIKKLSEKNDLNSKSASQACKLLTSLLFNELSELVDKDRYKNESNQFANENISKIESFINKNLSRRFTLEDVSKHVFLSTRQISRIIEKSYGKSFVDLVNEKRLTSAEMLLKKTDMKIAEIAVTTFPENANYFYTLFKKKHGMTPLNYRKQMKV